MKKSKLIKKSDEFTSIISKKNCIKSKYLSIYYVDSDNTLYGITVPKKVGKANIRNKLKRRIKNIIRKNELHIQNNIKYVIIIKEPSKGLDYLQLENEFVNLIKKVRK